MHVVFLKLIDNFIKRRIFFSRFFKNSSLRISILNIHILATKIIFLITLLMNSLALIFSIIRIYQILWLRKYRFYWKLLTYIFSWEFRIPPCEFRLLKPMTLFALLRFKDNSFKSEELRPSLFSLSIVLNWTGKALIPQIWMNCP